MRQGAARDRPSEVYTLPPYITDRKNKVNTAIEQSATGPCQNMTVAINQLKGCMAILRESCDVVEGSVVALGVPTAHRLITSMSEARETMERLQPLWQSAQVSSRNTNKMWEELYDSLGSAYFSLKQRNESLERESQQATRGEDRKDAIIDKAIQYILAVVAERAQWQEAHRYNPQQLPLEEASFADKTRGALDALYAMRSTGRGDGLPITKVGINSVDDSAAIGDRWSSAENTRHALITPSSRLHYVPPLEEVSLLREVLTLGTGSTTLMKDIQVERERLTAAQEEVHAQCATNKAALQKMREELNMLKYFLKFCMDTKSPFVSNRDQIVKLLNERVAEEVRSITAMQKTQWVHQQYRKEPSFDKPAQASSRTSSASSQNRTPPLIEEEIEQLRQWHREGGTSYKFPREPSF